MLAVVAGATVWSARDANAQTSGQRIEKVANQRLSGTWYARIAELSYDACASRCLSEPQCVAIEHHRGSNFVIGRKPQCKLFSEAGAARASNVTDVGYKRSGARPRAPAPVAADSKKGAQEAKRKEDQLKAPPRTGAAAPPAGGSASPPPPGATPPVARSAPPPPPPPAAAPPRPLAKAAPPPPPPPPVAAAPPPPVAAPPSPVDAPQPAPSRPQIGAARPQQPTTAPPSAGAPPQPRVEAARPRSIAPPPASAAPTEWDVVPVFYGTDRNRRDIPNKRIGYGSDRAFRVEIGRALVTVPKIHQVPKIERPWKVTIPYVDVTLYEEKEDPRKHFTIQELKAMSKAELLQLVRDRLAVSNAYRNQAMVLIHGYNNGFDDALYRTAQVTYDLNFDGASFLYSWPSGSGISQYLYDRDSAGQAEPHLTQFLQMVLNETGADRVNLIAHSMGSHLLMQVLRYMKDRNPGISQRINQIILAAPDIDRDTFAYLAGEVRGVGQGITMYASSNDIALQVSRRFAGDKPRAGDVPSGIGPAIVEGIDTIDVSSLSTDYLSINHSSYAEKTPLLRDIELVLKTGQRPPEQRFPVYIRVPGDRGVYWRYPN